MDISEGVNYYADLRYSKTNKHAQTLKDYWEAGRKNSQYIINKG